MIKHKTTVHNHIRATTMLFSSLGLVVSILLFGVACGNSGSKDSTSSEVSNVSGDSQNSNLMTTSPADADVTSNSDDRGAKITVKLLDPGADPRTALRYKFKANKSYKMIMEMNMAMAMQFGGNKQPEIQMPVTRMTMNIDNKDISSDGNLQYEFNMSQIDVLSNPGDDPSMVNAMKQQMVSMVGTSGSATVSPRGFTSNAKIKPPAGISPQIKQYLDNMKQSLNQMSAPFPEEPVGEGASWQVTMPMETPAMKFTQIATYTLSEIKGENVILDVVITQSAPKQEIKNPDVPAGMKMSLESLKSNGRGTANLNLAELIPTSDMNVTTVTVVLANGQKMVTTVRMGMKIHP